MSFSLRKIRCIKCDKKRHFITHVWVPGWLSQSYRVPFCGSCIKDAIAWFLGPLYNLKGLDGL